MPQSAPMSTARFFSALWRIAQPYWVSEERWTARGLGAVVIAMNLGIVYVNVLINQWNNAFYNALQNLDAGEFFHQIKIFCVLAAVFIVLAVYQQYLNQMLRIRWRRWMTERYVGQWLQYRAYYRMQLGGEGTDNPDQRISQDIQQFMDYTVSLSLGLLRAIVTLLSFLAILWTLSGSLTFQVWGMEISVPGYMVWVALVYAVAGTWLTSLIGRRLTWLNFEQERREADFRFALVRLRENAEQVAFLGGEARERDTFMTRFARVFTNYRDIMSKEKQLNWFTVLYGQAAIVFPYIVAAPRYFSKEIQLGGLMQTASAFNEVQTALSFIINSYSQIANWRAVVQRLVGFEDAVARSHAAAAAPAIEHQPSPDGAVRTTALALGLPNGQTLRKDLNLEIKPAERVVIAGPSGSGKSTLLRAIAGIWPFGGGAVAVPPDKKALFLPQKPYLPLGTLRQALAYPTEPRPEDEKRMIELLRLCGLPQLVDDLDREENWTQALSLGEQQRVALARVLLQRPDIVYLDEASSALDVPTEERLYKALIDSLPQTTIVSVAHRPTVKQFHTRTIELGQPTAA
jgi:vitamin B12/bleomycin/antimicrobial peptide transport system ATP-binding/permease protein